MHAAAAIPSTGPSTTSLSGPTADPLLKEIGIPPCPAVLAEFMAESAKDEPDVRRLSHLVNKDVALAASVLKTVNSPLYGLSRKARTVQDALTLLGLQETSRLIAGFLLRQAFASSDSPAMYEYWDASSRIALIAAYLARELEVARLDEAHTFALFRDCGVPVLLVRHPDYEKLLVETRCANERVRTEIERTAYGYDHALVGATLAQNWHLPTETWQAIRMHLTYADPGFLADEHARAYAPLIALGLLAEQMHRIHRGTYEAALWVDEEAFIAAVLGAAVTERLEPLAHDIAAIMEQR
jgi:HD-like signal output (HDOD) protein